MSRDVNLWHALAARLATPGPDLAYETTAGITRLEEYAQQHPVVVPVVHADTADVRRAEPPRQLVMGRSL